MDHAISAAADQSIVRWMQKHKMHLSKSISNADVRDSNWHHARSAATTWSRWSDSPSMETGENGKKPLDYAHQSRRSSSVANDFFC